MVHPSLQHRTQALRFLVFASLLTVFLVLTIAGCGGSDDPVNLPPAVWNPVTEEVVGTGGAVISGDEFSLEIPAGALTAETTVSVSSRAGGGYTLLDSRLTGVGTVFLFQGLTEFSQPVTFQLTFDPASISPADSVLIYIEEEVLGRNDEPVMAGKPLQGTVVDRVAGTISGTLPARTFAKGRGLAKADNNTSIIVSVSIAGDWRMATFGDEFLVTWLSSQVDQAWVDELIGNLNDAKTLLAGMGFDYCGFSWDYIEVTVRPIAGSDGNFIQSKFGVSDSVLEIDPGISGSELRASAGHELFHLMQMCFGDCGHYFGYDHNWLSEACSVWFEPILLENPTYVATVQSANRGFTGDGLEANTDNAGYGASVFMTWLTDKYGRELVLEIHRKVAEDPGHAGGGAYAVNAALQDRGSWLKLEFRDFAQEYLLNTTSHSEWMSPAPANCPLGPDSLRKEFSYAMMDLSANAINVAVGWAGDPTPPGHLTVSLAAGLPVFIQGFVYVAETSVGPWTLAGTALSGNDIEVQNFGTGTQSKAKVVLVNLAGVSPFNAVAEVDVAIEFTADEIAYPADEFTMDLAVATTITGGPAHVSDGEIHEIHPVQVSGNVFAAEWDEVLPGNYHAVGTFNCVLNDDHDAIISWDLAEETYNSDSDIEYLRNAGGQGVGIPLYGSGDDYILFSVYGEDACPSITDYSYRVAYRTSGELVKEVVSYTCDAASHISIWLAKGAK